MFRAATERAGIRLNVDCEALGVWAFVDREMWAKIVSNLLSNALKFTFEGSITVSVRQFLAEDSSAWVELRVSDTGIGISEDDQSHLFERFYRVEGVSSRSFEGSGIGLALVAELVNLHGGHIEASSVPGQGSTFSVQLPAPEGESWRPDAPVSAVAEAAAIEDITSGFVAEAMRWLANAEERRAKATAERRRRNRTSRSSHVSLWRMTTATCAATSRLYSGIPITSIWRATGPSPFPWLDRLGPTLSSPM